MKSSLENCTNKAKIQKIDAYILIRMQINEEKRRKLVNMLKDNELTVPLVQRINQRVFVVRCEASLSFPIGLLHVINVVEPNEIR